MGRHETFCIGAIECFESGDRYLNGFFVSILHIMKKIFALFVAFQLMLISLVAQTTNLPPVDNSPMDMSYFPDDYPKQKMITPDIANPVVRVIYSRPQKNKRIIFADTSVTQNVIQHYGSDWRLGANEATEIEFFKPVIINEKTITPGRYIMYCIPYADKWKIILNSNLYSWGLHLDKTKDVANVELPVLNNSAEIEYFTIVFQKANYGCDLVMAWGNIKAQLPISFN